MRVPSNIAGVSIKSNAFSERSFLGRTMRWLWFGLLMMLLAVAGYAIYQGRSNIGQTRDRDLEVRLDFIPFQPRPEFRDSLAMTLRGDGKVRVIHHWREMLVDAVYEGTLPETDAMRLLARTRQARREFNLLNKAPGQGDDALFSMVVLPAGSSDETSIFGGSLGDASEGTRRLVEDLLVLWNRLEKAPPAEAYLRSISLPAEELKRIQQNEQRRSLSVAEVPVDLQPILINSLNRPRDFVPITRTQHDQLTNYRQFIITNNGFSYRLTLSLPTPLSRK